VAVRGFGGGGALAHVHMVYSLSIAVLAPCRLDVR
jgi:hypothetical protein